MLRDVKVGDRVKSCLAGWGTVKLVDDGPMFPVMVKFDAGIGEIFTLEGKRNENHLAPEIVEVQKKKKWEPEGGNYFIDGQGIIWHSRTFGGEHIQHTNEGRAYPTKALAEKAHKMIRPYQRLVAYVLEHAPDWQPDWEDDDQYTYCIVYNHDFKQWGITGKLFTECFTIHMPKNVAEELCEKLNSGEVEL